MCKTLEEIMHKCKYYGIAFDEYNPFDACHKNGLYGKNSDFCNPTQECARYCK